MVVRGEGVDSSACAENDLPSIATDMHKIRRPHAKDIDSSQVSSALYSLCFWRSNCHQV